MVTLFRHHFHLTTLLQALFEACLFFGLVYFSVGALPHGSLSPAPSPLLPAMVFAVAMLGVSTAFGLYRPDQPLGVAAVAPRFLISLLIALPIAYAVFTVYPQAYRGGAGAEKRGATPVPCTSPVRRGWPGGGRRTCAAGYRGRPSRLFCTRLRIRGIRWVSKSIRPASAAGVSPAPDGWPGPGLAALWFVLALPLAGGAAETTPAATDAQKPAAEAQQAPEPKAVSTQGEVRIGGGVVRYTATVGWLIMKDDAGKPVARGVHHDVAKELQPLWRYVERVRLRIVAAIHDPAVVDAQGLTPDPGRGDIVPGQPGGDGGAMRHRQPHPVAYDFRHCP